MTLTIKSIVQYLSRNDRDKGRTFVANSCLGIEQVVVIPALAERDDILETLRRLSTNPPTELGRTLVICVINNRREGIAAASDIENNQQTIMLLRRLIEGDADSLRQMDGQSERQAREIIFSGLRLAWIDASSRGMEMPDQGGVGLARKIGLDMALSLFDYQSQTQKLLFNLDADTWVEPGYFSAVRYLFENQKPHAAVVRYAHRPEDDPALQAAICCYEIFLRYYVLGLEFAGSPYAFPSMGSAMICTPESYAAVRGMNRREAAEDFYFLDKIAKLGPVARIHTTTVHPSARPSRRVPFGTGQRMIRFLAGKQDEYLLYDPAVFRILKRWLEMMGCGCRQKAKAIMVGAENIHPLLASFLELNRFEQVWQRIQKNHRESGALIKQFHVWFDGFRTMKLVRYLTDGDFPQGEMFSVLKNLFELMEIQCPIVINDKTRSSPDDRMRILDFLRQCENPNMSLTGHSLSYN